MLTSLHVTGFRDLADLKVERLSRVNLFVGTNNSGKTSLLEAAEILLGEGSLRSILAGPLRRGESVTSEANRNNREVEVRHLFRGHQLVAGTGFEISGMDGVPQAVALSLDPYDAANFVEEGDQELDDDGLPPPGAGLVLTLRSLVFDTFEVVLNHAGRVPLADPDIRKHIAGEPDIGFNFVTTSGLNVRQIGQIWDDVVLTSEETTVLEVLRIIEPEIERIAFVGREAATTCLIKLRGRDERIPLGSMGEGIRRVLALAAGLARSRGPARTRCLLIDEIDTGLHHSVMAHVWRVVVDLAHRLDLQVFATTHSLDCLHALAELYEGDASVREDVLLHRIEKGATRTTIYTADELPVIREHRMEVRG